MANKCTEIGCSPQGCGLCVKSAAVAVAAGDVFVRRGDKVYEAQRVEVERVIGPLALVRVRPAAGSRYSFSAHMPVESFGFPWYAREAAAVAS